jgi:hypothetical protein
MNDAAPSPEAEALAGVCARTAQSAQKALEWFASFPDKVGSERAALEKDFRKRVVDAQKLESAVKRPVTVGVYGISQAGKSFMISTLARPPGKELFADLGQPVNFIAEINPESQKEATGLVTRFTMQKDPGPADFPVKLRLLSEVDLVKIFANSWYLDNGELAEEPPLETAAINDLLAKAERAAPAQANGEIRAEDIWDLQDYCASEFRNADGIKQLGASYWDRLSALAPRITLEQRAELYEVLWSKLPEFTQLFLRLAARLRSLRFDSVAFAQIAALRPKTESVLSVDTLSLLTEKNNKTVDVVARNGARLAIERPELTALVYELHITMVEQPWPMFGHTDLLDFPGARSRKQENLRKELKADPRRIAEYFLRGKVAYLFDHYCAERELNAMLLCVGPSNNEVSDMKRLIRKWVGLTHGAKAEQRATQPNALFVVMTKMDVHFDRTPGRSDDASSDDLWSARFTASLLQPFQEAGGWVDEWHPGQPFVNCLMARNPAKSQSMTELDAQGREAGFRPGVEDKAQRWRQDFAANELVRRHVADPGRAWEAYLKLNDGGMSYLVERLTPACNPSLKLIQVRGQIDPLRQRIRGDLERWYVGDDIEKELEKRRAALAPVEERLMAAIDLGRFGALLQRFHLSPEEAREVLLREPASANAGNGGAPLASSAPAPRPAGGLSSAVAGLMRGKPTAPAATSTPGKAAPAPAPRDHAQIKADALVESWIAKLRGVSTADYTQAYFGLQPTESDVLVGELAAAAGRGKVSGLIAQALRETGGTERFDLAAARQATAAVQIINEQVNYLGFVRGGKPLDKRPSFPDEARTPVFAGVGREAQQGEIEDEPTPYAALYCASWLVSLGETVELNVRDREGSGAVDVKANEALGQVIRLLA